MRIYLDACTLNRLTDDQRHPRIRTEAEAVETIFGMVAMGKVRWIAGNVLKAEISRNPNFRKREDALALIQFADEQPAPSIQTIERAMLLEQYGYGAFDALHLATAEQAGADVLLTTDDRFLKQAGRGLGNPAIAVLNPLDWLKGLSHDPS